MIAEGFVRSGARVVITARKAEACDATAERLSELGTCVSIPADLSSEEGRAAFAAAVAEREPALHVLVNNAGATWGAPLDEFPASGWDKVMNVNLGAPFALTAAAAAAAAGRGERGGPGADREHRVDRRHARAADGELLVLGVQGRG